MVVHDLFFSRSFRGVYAHKPDFDFDVMAFCLYGVTVIDTNDLELAGHCKRR
jgi:hypothetical protein